MPATVRGLNVPEGIGMRMTSESLLATGVARRHGQPVRRGVPASAISQGTR